MSMLFLRLVLAVPRNLFYWGNTFQSASRRYLASSCLIWFSIRLQSFLPFLNYTTSAVNCQIRVFRWSILIILNFTLLIIYSMSSYLDKLHQIELSRRALLQTEISRSAYQKILERSQIAHLERELDRSRALQIERNIAIETELSRRRELELRIEQERQLELQRQATQKLRISQERIRLAEAEIDGVRRSIDLERAQQQRIQAQVLAIDTQIAELYRLSDERERVELSQFEQLDKAVFQLQKLMRDSQFKKNAYATSIQKMSQMAI